MNAIIFEKIKKETTLQETSPALLTLWKAYGYIDKRYKLNDDERFVLSLETRRALLMIEDELSLAGDFTEEQYQAMLKREKEIIELTNDISQFRRVSRKQWWKFW